MIHKREQSMISMAKKGLKVKCHHLMLGGLLALLSSKLGMAQQHSDSTLEMRMTFLPNFLAFQALSEGWEAVA